MFGRVSLGARLSLPMPLWTNELREGWRLIYTIPEVHSPPLGSFGPRLQPVVGVDKDACIEGAISRSFSSTFIAFPYILCYSEHSMRCHYPNSHAGKLIAKSEPNQLVFDSSSEEACHAW